MYRLTEHRNPAHRKADNRCTQSENAPFITMRHLLLILLLSCRHFGFSQDTSLKTFSGKAVEKNTCIFQIKLVDLISKDTLNNAVVKPKIERFIDYLSSCD